MPTDLDAYAKERRNNLAGANKCINGPRHQTPRDGHQKCDWCKLVHRIGVEAALTRAGESKTAPQPPPGYKVQLPRRKP